MRKSIFKIALTAAALLMLGAGCSSASTGPDGGMFRSLDAGATWTNLSRVLTSNGVASSFILSDVNFAARDPQDIRAFWVGTMAQGIFYSFDGGAGWTQAVNYSPAEMQLTSSVVNGIFVDPKDSCTVYATIIAPTTKSYLIRTTTCGRWWTSLYSFDEMTNSQLRAIAINPNNSQQLFLGDTAGDIFRSNNAGTSWEKIYKLPNHLIRSFVIHPNGTIFAATSQAGVLFSSDGGDTWNSADLKKYPGASEVYTLVLDPTQTNSLLIGTKYGILRSGDLGQTWTPLELLTGPNETQIISIGLNPKNSNRIYYGTPKGFYRTDDGGKTWSTKRLPTARVAKIIMVDMQKDTTGAAVESLWIGAWNPPAATN
ncbi:MAG: hypothetical protein NT003_05235 [Candidatus Magasanikbacteria bacterium]|nr:hypothetical protein [Candidatus Magasanikbacteria bacterium]